MNVNDDSTSIERVKLCKAVNFATKEALHVILNDECHKPWKVPKWLNHAH